MATSGSFTHSIKTGYRLVVEWSATQSTANNTSTVTVQLYLQSLSSGYTIVSSTDKTAWIEIDGVRSTNNSTNVTLSGNQKKLMHTYTRTLSHNSDGTKSFTIRASQEFGFSFAGSYTGTVTTSVRTYTLNTIPRSSTFTFVTIPNIRDDILQDMTINISRASTSFTHRLSLYAGSTFIQNWTGLGGGNQTVTLTTLGRNRILDAMPTSTSRIFEFRLRTYDSSNSMVGSDSNRDRRLYINALVVRPTLGSITTTESNSTVINSVITNWVQGISQPRIAVPTYSAPRGATVARIRVTFDGSSSTATNPSGTVTRTFNAPNSGTRSISVVVTDSRGVTNSNTSQGSIVVYSYQPPNITKYDVYRSDLSGNPVEDSTTVAVDRAVSISTVGNQNRVRYRLSRRERGLTTWTIITNWTAYGTSSTGLTTHTTYELNKAWEFRIEFQDYLRTSVSEALVPTESVTMSWGEFGLGIGKIWERGALDIRGSGYFTGTLLFEDVAGTGIGESGEAIRIGENREMAFSLFSNTGVIYINRDIDSTYSFRIRGHNTAQTGTFGTDFGIRRSDRHGVFLVGLESQGYTYIDGILDTTNVIRTSVDGGMALKSSQYSTYGMVINDVVNVATFYIDADKIPHGFRIRTHNSGSVFSNIFTVSGAGNVSIPGDLTVTGNKNVVVDTVSYGKRLMNALETPDSRFVSYMERTLPIGIHTINIEPMFKETISEFFIVPHVQNGSTVKLLSKTPTSFTVEVTEEIADVVFEVNGRRVGFEHIYMEKAMEPKPESELIINQNVNIQVTGIKGGDANE